MESLENDEGKGTKDFEMTDSDLEEKLEVALDPFADRIKRASAIGQVLREFLCRIQKLEIK